MTGVTVALVLATGASAAVAQDRTLGAEAFGRQVFAAYAAARSMWPMHEESLDAVFTERMAAMIRRDRELAVEGPPYSDADPLCQCANADELTVLSVEVFSVAPMPVMRVTFTNGGETLQTVMAVEERPGKGWRIDDLYWGDGYSFLNELDQSNQRAEAGGRALKRN